MKKYLVGKKYTNINNLVKDLNDGKYVFWYNRLKHPSILKHMMLKTVEDAIKNGIIKEAKENLN